MATKRNIAKVICNNYQLQKAEIMILELGMKVRERRDFVEDKATTLYIPYLPQQKPKIVQVINAIWTS